MAGHPMILPQVYQARLHFPAFGQHIRTAGMEITARWWLAWAGHISQQYDSFPLNSGIRDGYRGQQRFRIGMLWISEDRFCVRHLHDSPQIHDCNPIGNVLHHT